MKNHRMKDALDNIARQGVPENTNLWPDITARLDERNTIMKTLQLRPALAVSLALVILLALSGVAYAIGNTLGYIPGVGIVEHSTPLRVLAEPVRVTRDGITITVKEAVISSDKTTVAFTMDNVPVDKLSPPISRQCPQPADLRLSDGTSAEESTVLRADGGEANSENGSRTTEWRLMYAPLPAGVNDATLLVPCIPDAAQGVLPENWELPLHFVSAPDDMQVMPVTEVTSSAGASGSGAATQTPLSILQVIDKGDRYILVGEFDPPAPSQAVEEWYASGSVRLSDANGQEITYDFAQDIELPEAESPKADVWAIEFSKAFTPPVHITYSGLYTLRAPGQETVEFEFDAGPNPQEGQAWQLDKDILLAGRQFRLVSVRVSPANFYSFQFTSSDNLIASVGIEIPGYTPNGGGADSCGCIELSPISWGESLGYTEMPKGTLKVVLSGLWIYGEAQDWTLEWQP